MGESDSNHDADMRDDGQDAKVYKDISTAACVAVIVAASPLYFYFDYQGKPFRGLVAAMSAVIVIGLPLILRPLTRNSAFWPTLSLIGIAHVALVYFLPYTGDFRFGFAYFPLFFVDAYLSARLIIYACGGSDR